MKSDEMNYLDIIVDFIEKFKRSTKAADKLQGEYEQMFTRNKELRDKLNEKNEQLEIDRMMKNNVPSGRVIFIFRDGYREEKLFGTNCAGIMHKGKRPVWFTLRIEERSQLLTKSKIEKLNQWIDGVVDPAIDHSYYKEE